MIARDRLIGKIDRPVEHRPNDGGVGRRVRGGGDGQAGDGAKRINPIHEVDLAEVCVDAITNDAKAIDVGGPKAYTRKEIAELAFAAAGKPPKLRTFPLWLASVLGAAMRPMDKRLAEVFAFGVATSRVDCLAPPAGSRTLESYYADVQSAFKREG